jgi:hypothetical protein
MSWAGRFKADGNLASTDSGEKLRCRGESGFLVGMGDYGRGDIDSSNTTTDKETICQGEVTRLNTTS